MNDSHPTDAHSNNDDDDRIRDLLTPLKNLEPGIESRVRNRMTVAEALARLRRPAGCRAQKWWQRSLSIRVPAAISLAVVVLATFAIQEVRHRDRNQQPADPVASVRKSSTGAENPLPERIEDTSAREQPAELEYYATATYLCGIGTLESEFIYTFVEN